MIAALRDLVVQLRYRHAVHELWGFARDARGQAITALFAGPSGTGKTLAAEVIARETSLDLYHVDLSQVVDKYVGETEKRLRRIFEHDEIFRFTQREDLIHVDTLAVQVDRKHDACS